MANPRQHANMQHWLQSMQAQIAIQRQQLLVRDLLDIARRSGAEWVESGPAAGVLALRFFNQQLQVQVPGYTVVADGGQAVPAMTEALVITYVLMADGAPRAGEWIAFRELPDGMFYHRAFTGYTGQKLARVLGPDLDAFRRGAVSAGGTALSAFGDAAYEFHVLPRLWLAVVYWLGDDEEGFPSQARVLFDRAAGGYMHIDGLAIIGSQLVGRMIATAGS